jgi:hypothetical protein
MTADEAKAHVLYIANEAQRETGIRVTLHDIREAYSLPQLWEHDIYQMQSVINTISPGFENLACSFWAFAQCDTNKPMAVYFNARNWQLAGYSAVLHELGHCFHPEGHCFDARMKSELYAWQWAMDRAAFWDINCHVSILVGLTSHWHQHGRLEFSNDPAAIAYMNQLLRTSAARAGMTGVYNVKEA